MRASCTQTAGGSGSPAAPKPSGQAGDKRSRDTNRRMAIQGNRAPAGRARAVGAQIHENSLLSVFDGPRASALADGARRRARRMGAEAESVVGNLIAANPGAAYGLGRPRHRLEQARGAAASTRG